MFFLIRDIHIRVVVVETKVTWVNVMCLDGNAFIVANLRKEVIAKRVMYHKQATIMHNSGFNLRMYF